MKRISFHLLFWFVYLIQDVVLIYLLNTTRWPGHSSVAEILAAVENCLICLVPKLLFTYFMLYVLLRRIDDERLSIAQGVLYTIAAFLATLLLYRALVVYWINPVIYDWPSSEFRYADLLGFLVALMDIGFASGAAIVIRQIRFQIAAKERASQLVREKLETELKFLRSQTHPHFLFNTLNNIYALTRKKSDEAPAAVMKLSKLLRFMLYEAKRTSITIGEELKNIDDYIDLEKMRFSDRLTVTVQKDIDNEQEQISPLLLLPFVENAFKHGPGESRFAATITIELRLRCGMLLFLIRNTTEPASRSSAEHQIGLQNVRRQLQLTYREHHLEVKEENKIFEVELSVNLHSHAKI